MDTLVLLSKLLVLLSKIFSTGGFALTSTDKPLNMIFSFFSVVAASSPWLHLIRTANIADLFVFSLFSLILLSRLEIQKNARVQQQIYFIFQSMLIKVFQIFLVKFCNLDLIRKLLPIYTILADLFESCQIFVFIRRNLQRNST